MSVVVGKEEFKEEVLILSALPMRRVLNNIPFTSLFPVHPFVSFVDLQSCRL
jgi:hypothetical protein